MLLLSLVATAMPSVPTPAGKTDGRAPTTELARIVSGHATIIAYDVDANGKVTHCSIHQSSGAPELDQRACAIFLEKASFNPRRDSRGRAIADINRKTRIVWNVEE
jgi:TonB family protein